MKIKCLYNTGKELLQNSYRPNHISEFTQFNELVIGKEYIVMGHILFKDSLGYLIDDGIVTVCPCQLFEITDSKLPKNWYFKLLKEGDSGFPYVIGIWGYSELCEDNDVYEKIIEQDEHTIRTYFRRKIEYETIDPD